MADEFVGSCLPIFRDSELEDDQRLEEVQKVLLSSSTLHGQQLERLTLRVAHLCRERIQSEAASQARSSPSRTRIPQVQVQRPSSHSLSCELRSSAVTPMALCELKVFGLTRNLSCCDWNSTGANFIIQYSERTFIGS